MEFKDIIIKAQEIQKKYRMLSKKRGFKVWGVNEYMQGFVGDVGDLSKLIMAKENFRHSVSIDKKLSHELSDCLWSIIIISKELGIDLEKGFLASMKKIDKKI